MKYLGAPQSGSQAATTAGRNRFGQYYRNRRSPVNPNTARQTTARAILADCSSAWSSLELAEREAWQSWADLHPRTDSLGSTVVLTGAQAFNAVNCLLVACQVTAVGVPPLDPAPEAPVLVPVTMEAGEYAVGWTPTPVPALHRLVIYATPPMSGGASFSRDFRLLRVVAAAVVPPINLEADYIGRYGELGVGQRVIWRAKLLRADGAVSTGSNTRSAVMI